MDAVQELKSEFLEVFPGTEVADFRHLEAKRFLVRVIRKTRRFLPRTLVLGRAPSAEAPFQFCVQMGPDFALTIPAFFRRRRNFIYMFDAWPRTMPWILDFVDFFNVHAVFFSSRQSCQLFNSMRASHVQPGRWLPEGIAPSDYSWLPLDEKIIDVLEFGRRNASYHDSITPGLKAAGVAHLYSSPPKLLFHGKVEFCATLAKSRICVCFPSTVTHPDRAEGISTMTLRYLQAMLSKCLVLGIAPDDITEIFGYDPVVPIDVKDPVGQITEILGHFDRYESLVERNHQATSQCHLWRHRLASIRSVLIPEGSAP